MSGSLWGVVIGGLIALAPTCLFIINNNRRLSRERRVDRLEKKKEKIEKIFKSFRDDISEGGDSLEIFANVIGILPENVLRVYKEFLDEKDITKKKITFVKLHTEVHKALNKIDTEIEKLL